MYVRFCQITWHGKKLENPSTSNFSNKFLSFATGKRDDFDFSSSLSANTVDNLISFY